MVRSLALASFIALLGAGCGRGPVVIEVAIPDQSGQLTALGGTRVILLPYDRDSLLTVLERRAPSPRPSEARIDSLLAQFRPPFNEYLRLSAALDRAGGDSAARKALQDSAARARDALAAARTRLEPQISVERTRIRAWEDTAHRAYDSIGGALVQAGLRDPVVDSTGADGRVRFRLKRGAWWVTARAINVQDPNHEWYWNLRVMGDTVRLVPATAHVRLRT